MALFQQDDGQTLVWQMKGETVWIQPWGPNTLRVRGTMGRHPQDLPGALLDARPSEAKTLIGDDGGTITNGKIRAEITANGHLRFVRSDTGNVLLEEAKSEFFLPPERHYRGLSSELYNITVRFRAQPGERFYGMGQHPNGHLDQKGCVLDLIQINNEVPIPFLISNRGYGFIWHNPAIGRVELANSGTRWIAEASRQVDYLVIAADSYPELMTRYADLTGYPPVMPDWASGFWQCKLRYRTQEELMSVAREYKRRDLPISVIVADFFHWSLQGDWHFDPEHWPDPAGMVRELEDMGIKLMVSIWPTVNPLSENFELMRDKGWLVRTERGIQPSRIFKDLRPEGPVSMYYYDTTNPDARQFVWERVREGYYQHGIRVWWLDACEPGDEWVDFDNLHFYLGNGLEVANLYPLLHEQGFYEHLRAEGDEDVFLLCRAGWLGSQRYAASIWSGDIDSTFESLQQQVRAGLNMAMSGIPWWNTDIGGFKHGDTSTAYFRELIVRWFQFGVFCPICRLHGVREPFDLDNPTATGSDNELWSFGDDVYAILKDLVFLRERLRPYIMEQMQVAHQTGSPVMRPLFFDFQGDETCYRIEDQFMFGPDILVAPVLFQGAVGRDVYLPAGTHWTDAWTGETFDGGEWLKASAPLERIPVFLRGDQKPVVFIP